MEMDARKKSGMLSESRMPGPTRESGEMVGMMGLLMAGNDSCTEVWKSRTGLTLAIRSWTD